MTEADPIPRGFVPPPNLGAARDLLLDKRMVLLAGEPGNGRRTAARMLLGEFVPEPGLFALLDDEAHLPEERLDDAKVDVGQRFLLDLSDSDEETFRARQRELPAFAAALQPHDALLVVVLPEPRDHRIDNDLAGYVVPIGRPRGDQVLRRHLAATGIHVKDVDLVLPELAPHLNAPLRDIARLALLVAAARDRKPRATASVWLREAVAAFDRSRDVEIQFAAHPSARARAVLFAAALCQGSSCDAVFFAAQALIELLKLDSEKPHRLEQDGHRAQLRALGAEISPHGKVGFSRLAYDRAVRNFFWDNYPDLRERFRDWVDRIVRLAMFTRRDRERIVERFAEQTLRTECPQHLEHLIRSWVNPGPNDPKYLTGLGTLALLTGIQDERHGWRFRRQVREWACTDALPADVARLVVGVCTEVIAPSFPSQAMAWLHHRARRENSSDGLAARGALGKLTAGNKTLLRRWLGRLSSELDRLGQWQAADITLFLDLAAPSWAANVHAHVHALASDVALRPHLVSGWRTAIGTRRDLAEPALGCWLAAATDPGAPEAVLGILVEAVSHDAGQLGVLHVIARDWSLRERGRDRVSARLAELIDRAQGIQPGDFVIRSINEEVPR